MRLGADRRRVGLALGGGGARALAHLGVLDVLARERIPVDMIVGTSMGALVGGLYALEPDAAAVREAVLVVLAGKAFRRVRLEYLRAVCDGSDGSRLGLVRRYLRRTLCHGTVLTRGALVSSERYARHVEAFVGDRPIEETMIPFAAVATDVRSGDEVVITRGSMRTAVAASCAIPGILPPVSRDGRLLIDGGWVDQVPVRPLAALGAGVTIAVEAAAPREDARAGATGGLAVMIRASAITRATLCRLQVARADVVIRPATEAIHWTDFGRSRDAIRLGEEAARHAIPTIRAILERKRAGQASTWVGSRAMEPGASPC